MTIIAALQDKNTGEVFIGSDTLAVVGYEENYSGPKFMQVDEWWVGIAGHIRAATLIQGHAYLFEKSAARRYDTEAFDLLEGIRKLLIKDDWSKSEDVPGAKQFACLEGLLAHPVGGVWHFDSRFGLTKFRPGDLATGGSGSEAARGADTITADRYLSDDRVKCAIYAAIRVCHDCGGHAWLQSIGVPEDAVDTGTGESQDEEGEDTQEAAPVVERGQQGAEGRGLGGLGDPAGERRREGNGQAAEGGEERGAIESVTEKLFGRAENATDT